MKGTLCFIRPAVKMRYDERERKSAGLREKYCDMMMSAMLFKDESD
jgi:hypothetical protein